MCVACISTESRDVKDKFTGSIANAEAWIFGKYWNCFSSCYHIDQQCGFLWCYRWLCKIMDIFISKPEFCLQMSKSVGVVIPVSVEINCTILSTLDDCPTTTHSLLVTISNNRAKLRTRYLVQTINLYKKTESMVQGILFCFATKSIHVDNKFKGIVMKIAYSPSFINNQRSDRCPLREENYFFLWEFNFAGWWFFKFRRSMIFF